MSDSPENNAENAAAEAAPAKGKVMMMAVGGLVIGLAGGFLGVGPVLAKNKATPAAKVEAKAEKGGEGGEKGAGAAVWPIENLVLNPAGSNGARFLMVNATFELKDEAAKESAKDKEAEARDIILALLGKKTVDQLTDVAQRDQIKKEVLAAVAPLFPKGTVTKVFFPQFVIQ
ncbi:MAG TPA: flagellar basal body-associated FliL family protein [Gemmatimonadaceae bacterium]|jgi:flagellar FliL protein